MHSNSKMTSIQVALPPLQALALSKFLERLNFDTVACFASVSVVTDDGKSEADLIWLAMKALRQALDDTAARR